MCGVERNPYKESKNASGQDEPKRVKMEVEVIKAQKKKTRAMPLKRAKVKDMPPLVKAYKKAQ